jgi:hypothetical protein
MVRLIAALFLLVGVLKIAGPWTRHLQDPKVFAASPLQEENSKGESSDAKEKQEQEQNFFEPGFMISAYPGNLIKHSYDSHRITSSGHDEPPCPPPDIMHS